MPRTKATDRLTIKGLSADDLAWLKAESDRLGCDPENLVRMMVRQRSSAVVVPVGFPPPRQPHRQPYEEKLAQELADQHAEEMAQTPALDDPEPGLDEIMAQAPVLRSEPPPQRQTRPLEYAQASRPTPYDPIAAQRGGRGTQFQRRASQMRGSVLPYPTGAYSAFSETEPVVSVGFIGERPMERFASARGR